MSKVSSLASTLEKNMQERNQELLEQTQKGLESFSENLRQLINEKLSSISTNMEHESEKLQGTLKTFFRAAWIKLWSTIFALAGALIVIWGVSEGVRGKAESNWHAYQESVKRLESLAELEAQTGKWIMKAYFYREQGDTWIFINQENCQMYQNNWFCRVRQPSEEYRRYLDTLIKK